MVFTKDTKIREITQHPGFRGFGHLFPIYDEDEMVKDPSKRETGLFYFKGKEYEKFALINAGGGFHYVAALHDSFPQAVALPMLVIGIGQAMVVAPVTAAGIYQAPDDLAGSASGLTNAMHQIGGPIGLSVIMAMTSNFYVSLGWMRFAFCPYLCLSIWKKSIGGFYEKKLYFIGKYPSLSCLLRSK